MFYSMIQDLSYILRGVKVFADSILYCQVHLLKFSQNRLSTRVHDVNGKIPTSASIVGEK